MPDLTVHGEPLPTRVARYLTTVSGETLTKETLAVIHILHKRGRLAAKFDEIRARWERS